MHRVSLAGGVLTVVGLIGYLFGIATPYPGRAFSVAAIMVGLTLVAIGYSDPDGEDTTEGFA
ncbi:MAG: hypothetical protein ABEJ28_11255 [Salinigranum sp.]